ncbi:MAG TPA: membrane protein insertase YidC [Steroidobacteraceae bacterium]|nr:membrane protein insertase YidC [Steroidobacteraceae bacterium]
MANTRIMLWFAFFAILYLNYEAWMHDYHQPAPVSAAMPQSGSATAPKSLADSVPAGSAASAPPAASGAAQPTAPATAASPPGATGTIGAAPGEPGVGSIHVATDVLSLDINLKGGEIDRADLTQYPVHKDKPNVPVQLENTDPNSLYLLQTGLIGTADEAAPTHLAVWTSPKNTYVLPAGANELRVPLTWTDGQGLTVTKTFVFARGWYAINLVYDVHNESPTARSLASYGQILRHWEHASRSYFDVETYSFKGPDVFDGTKTRDLRVENESDSKFAETITNGWLASLQHHFVSAIVPPSGQPYDYRLQVLGHEYLLSATGPFKQVPPGASAEFHEKLFVGPKLQSQLAVTGPRLERTADYGRLTVIAQPLFAALKFVHSVTGNWGWAIIIVTALIKLIFFPLSQASGRSMAKMRAVAPRMKQIQETYKDDREKLGRAMMELYKREKINPLAGCLPMVVQIPVFIAFYWVLLESVEMRQAPFMLWINDLSSRDPYFVLPLLMGAAMFAQFKLNPAPPDPMQAKLMQFMPLVMTAMMAWFPSGLVLYWITNTVLGILQQWNINRRMESVQARLKR